VVAGLLLSYHHGTAAGATMAGVSVAMFFVVLVGQELLGAWRRVGLAPER
jgi:ABC-type Mn2+/Zn2+ transport system permease subunit